jgi:hypothetical protein
MEAARGLLVASEMRDARPAVRALRDANWQLRQLGLIRLRTLGLPAEWVRELSPLTHPDAKLPGAAWPPLVAAREYADALEVAATKPPAISPAETVETLVGMIAERLVDGPDQPPLRRRLLHELLAYQSLLPPPRRAWLATAALAALDEQDVLRDLRARGLAAAVGEDGKPILRWLARNDPYLYWHPRRAQFRVDLAARRAGEPSASFRRHTPWGRGEGPQGE